MSATFLITMDQHYQNYVNPCSPRRNV